MILLVFIVPCSASVKEKTEIKNMKTKYVETLLVLSYMSLLSYTTYVEIVGNLNSHAIRDVDNIKVAVSRNITSQSSKNSTPRSVRYRGVDIF